MTMLVLVLLHPFASTDNALGGGGALQQNADFF